MLGTAVELSLILEANEIGTYSGRLKVGAGLLEKTGLCLVSLMRDGTLTKLRYHAFPSNRYNDNGPISSIPDE